MEIQIGDVSPQGEIIEKPKDDANFKDNYNTKISILPTTKAMDSLSIEEIDTSPNLKRKQEISDPRPLKFRKKEEKRVSFGGNIEFLISPRVDHNDFTEPTNETQDIDSLLLFYTNETNFEEYAAELAKQLQIKFESTKFQINSALDHLRDVVGFHKIVPTLQEIDDLTVETQDLENELENLQNELNQAIQNIDHESALAKTHEEEILKILEKDKIEYEQRINLLTENNDHYRKIFSFYNRLLNLKADRKGCIFTCVGGAEFKFEIDTNGKYIRYTPNEFRGDIGNMLRYEITDLRQSELSMLFMRILKHCITNSTNKK